MTSYPFLKALKAVEYGVDYAVGLAINYDQARDEAAILRRRVADLVQRAANRNELCAENRRLRSMLRFVRNEPRLTLEPVKVLENFKGILTIDRGARHGIHESMCVLTEDGIVGLVTEAGVLNSNVVTLQNVDCKIPAMILRNRVRGMVHGSGSDLNPYCTMQYIDMKHDVQENDLVVTSPESSIFPAGYPIGRIDRAPESGSLWKAASVEPAVDPYRLDEVFVVRRAVQPFEALAGVGPAGVPISVAPVMPDTRSLQECYAP